MRERRPLSRAAVGLLSIAAAAAALLSVVSAGGGATGSSSSVAGDWLGFVGGPRSPVSLGERMIVVLDTPSVAQRLARARFATESQERGWWAEADAAQKQVLLKLAAIGVAVQPDESFHLVLDGFSAVLDPRAVSLLQQMPEVSGVYPVRAAYPASISERTLEGRAWDDASGHRPLSNLPGSTGRGVTVALLDTGVDRVHPYLRGRVLPGYDELQPGQPAAPRADPQDPSQVERHGTELAGILAGAGGPAGLHGVAPGATVLPIRVAGWQPATDGRDLIYARSDQLIAGLDRAVDPNGDGDAHDAVRVALVGVSEPYGAFTDDPEARAVQGALDLNTVVVAPAGNDGAAGPGFGSVGGPAASGGAIAVAASDSRADLPRVRVVLRRGLQVILDSELPLLGPALPAHRLSLAVATPRAGGGAAAFFDANGLSRVAGRAVLAPAGGNAASTVVAAARAGAAAVLLYGPGLPPGALPVAEAEQAPVVQVPQAAAAELLASLRAGLDVGVAVGTAAEGPNAARGRIAGFSSEGLAFDSSVKPDVAAPGVAIATAEPGVASDGSALYGTITGTSAAAAQVAGAAALLVQERPGLDGQSLRSLLVGYAQAGGAGALAAGAGALRLGASAVGEVAAAPATLGFGVWGGSRWHATRTIVLRNVSTRRLHLTISAAPGQASESLHFTVSPDTLVLPEGAARRVRVTVRVPVAPPDRAVTGDILAAAAGSQTLRIPFALLFQLPHGSLLPRVSISSSEFAPSDTAPAILSVQAGAITTDGGIQVQPVSRLDVLLYDAAGRYLGVMARLRDLLPGSYSFGITGRGPASTRLPPGSYELRLNAWPALPKTAQPSRYKVRFKLL
ncbi:MAG TPA: S8 family serine peptidase [Gaiellaceae bacterium]|nr:S8 family serine peptidase [Gaiellaceae bacterium]